MNEITPLGWALLLAGFTLLLWESYVELDRWREHRRLRRQHREQVARVDEALAKARK